MDVMDEEIDIVPPTFLDELLEDEDGEGLAFDENSQNSETDNSKHIDSELDETTDQYEMDTDQPTDTSPEHQLSDNEDPTFLTEEHADSMETTGADDSTEPRGPELEETNLNQINESNQSNISPSTDSEDDIPLSQRVNDCQPNHLTIVRSNESLTTETSETDTVSQNAYIDTASPKPTSITCTIVTNTPTPNPTSQPAEPVQTSAVQQQSNEKPLTAYAYFFNDRQKSIRQANPLATYEQVSNIVQNMWKNLDSTIKQQYLEKANTAAGITVNRVTNTTAENKQDSTSTSIQVVSANITEIQDNTTPKAPQTPSKKPPARRRAPVRKATLPRACKTQPPPEICLREGCENEAVINIQWAHLYCSSKCVVQHCKDEFQKWIKVQE